MGSTNSTIIPLPLDDAFDLVCDPHTYPRWLVGAQEIRDVDDDWPAIGSAFRHRIGVGPFQIPGSTTIRAYEAPHVLSLAAGMGPFGEARVDFVLTALDAVSTEVVVSEAPTRGLARVGWLVSRPLIFGLLWGRNAVSLHSLADLAAEQPGAVTA
jgi:uncharacterized protein YndB with AHSA1/START domain